LTPSIKVWHDCRLNKPEPTALVVELSDIKINAFTSQICFICCRREEGVFDSPMSEERQLGMRAVQNTLERLDSKHGVLQRHASAECVRDSEDGDNDYLKRLVTGLLLGFYMVQREKVG